MAAKIIDGKEIARQVNEETARRVEALKGQGCTPGLAVVLIGDDPASQVYVNSKVKKCAELGIYSEKRVLPADATMEQVLALIAELNANPKIDGILVQSPPPKQIDEEKVIAAIDPEKDVDCFHERNVGRLLIGKKDGFQPCTNPQADRIMTEMMQRQKAVESTGEYSVDEAAEPTAWALSRLFAEGSSCMACAENEVGQSVKPSDDGWSVKAESSPQRRVLERLGYCLGRWVYLVDAMDDMAEDQKHGRYNPYLHRFGLSKAGAEEIDRARQEILPGLNVCISEACAAFELLEIHHFREIIHNILYYGLEQVQNSVANGAFRRSDRKEAK